ncbi:nucleotide-binding domain-containing protein [Salix suchowensis]|nr:nucleotide-binding domain-containing protein [Salix suchowensis]
MLATSWTLRAAFHTNRRVVLQIQRPSDLAFTRTRARGFASEGPSTSTPYPSRILRRAKTTAKYGDICAYRLCLAFCSLVLASSFTTLSPTPSSMLKGSRFHHLHFTRSVEAQEPPGRQAAAVGTVQFRSLIEPIRKIIARLRGHFVQAKAIDIVFADRLLEDKFKREGVNLITSARYIFILACIACRFTNDSPPLIRVSAITPEHVIYTSRNAEGKTQQHTIPSNFILWSTGIAMNPFASRVTDLLPNQVHRKAIETDAYLRVKGAPLGTVYAIGDCATIETSIVSHIMELVDEADQDKNGKIDFGEWEIMGRPADPSDRQVAAQQGKYVGKKLHKLAQRSSDLPPNQLSGASDEDIYGPFKYLHLGSLAYIGNAAVFDLGNYSFMGGLAAMYAWRSVYWNEQVSARTRALLMIDWIIR